MKPSIMAAAAAAVIMIGAASSAAAAQGCGPGLHRGPYGHCRPNRGPGAVVGIPALGVFYPGRGYWDGHRYRGHRERWHGGWRYR